MFVLIKNINLPLLFNNLFARGLSCYSIGVILGYLYLYCERINTRRIGGICLVIVVAIYISYRCEESIIGNIQGLFIMLIAPSILLSVLYVPWINKLFSLKPMARLGSLSIFVYLLHFPIQCLIRDIDLAFGIGLNYSKAEVWTLYFIVTILASAIYSKLLNKRVEYILSQIMKKILINCEYK